MKYGCKIYTQKCFVTLEWPLNVKFQTCVLATICAMCPQKIILCVKVRLLISRTKVPFFLKQHNTLFQSWAEHCLCSLLFISLPTDLIGYHREYHMYLSWSMISLPWCVSHCLFKLHPATFKGITY